MRYLRSFLHVLKRTFTSFTYYRDVLKAPFGFSLKYFLFFNLLLSLVVTLVLFISALVPLNEFLRRVPQVLVKVFPAELEIKVKNGEVTTNVPEPYFIPLDRIEKTFDELDNVKGVSTDKLQNILVIDTNASIDDLQKYHAFALLTKRYLSFYKNDGRIESVDLKQIDNLTINQRFVQGTLTKFVPLFQYLAIYLVPIIFVFVFFFFVLSQMFYLMFTAMVLFVIARVIAYPLSFGKAYQFDLHLTTIITPTFLLLSITGIRLEIPFIRLMVFSVGGYLILNELKNSHIRSSKAKK